MHYLIPFVIAFTLSIVFTLLAIKLSYQLKILDWPNARKIHKKPTPLLGGLAIFLSFIVSTIIFWQTGLIEDSRISNFNIIFIILASIVIMIGGILDDKYNLKPGRQIIFPLLAIILVITSGIRIQFVSNPLGGIIEFAFLPGIILTFFWLLGMVYTTKLLDGLDGLVSGITAIGATIIFIVSLYWDAPLSGTSILSLILVGSSLGFLIFNWNPAKIFLGEGGSVFCGFMLGVLSIISGSKIATALLIMGIPILDVVWVIIRRLFKSRSIATPDNKHLHFRLLDIGLSHKAAVLFLYITTASFGVTSIFLQSKGKLIVLSLLGLFMVILASTLVLIYKHQSINETKQ